MPSQFDVVVLGAGPAGEGASIRASKLGLSVAVVDEKKSVGGSCAHLGTIPSKALRQYVRQIMRFNTDPLFRTLGEARWLSFPDILQRAQLVVQQQVALRTTFYSRNRIELFFGRARFLDSNTVEVSSGDGISDTLKANHIVIATGSSPYRPPNVDFTHPRVYDSDTILKMQHTPRKIIIFGAGVIGCEYASIFSALGVRVELVDSRERLLDFLDHEISDALGYHLRENGVLIRHHEDFENLECTSSYVTLHLKSGKKIRADALLWCNGRSGNTGFLDLKAAGLKANERGQLKINEQYQTELPHIYAAGDVIGWPALASAAYDQGRSVGSAIACPDETYFVTEVPTGIYTIPEISSVGKTEQQLTDEKVPYEVGMSLFKGIARAQITGETAGVLKLLFHRETLQLLGIHCFGDQASEIIHIGQAIFSQQGQANTIEYFVNTTFNYPTMAEAYRVAALNGLNRIF
ncbi:MAG: Si-specific NAD(P)(+) transhydrogenase [Pseudomonadota bacterium]